MANSDRGMTFKEMERCFFAMMSEKTLLPPVGDMPTELIKDLKAAAFGVRYGATRKRIEDYNKELAEILGHSPDKQDAIASTCFILDSLSSLEK